MGYTPLDPKDAVVLFADLQAEIIERTATNDLPRLRRAVAALAKLAGLFDIPAIVTAAPAEGGPRVMPEIAAALGVLPEHVRTTTDAFAHAPTRDAIAQAGAECDPEVDDKQPQHDMANGFSHRCGPRP